MNPINKKPHPSQFKPVVAQLQTKGVKLPVAPPVYRPQSVPKVLQTKSASGQSQPRTPSPRQPVAPAVYRPQPIAKILQPKNLPVIPHQPVAPPLNRLKQRNLVQPKRPLSLAPRNVSQMKRTTPTGPTRSPGAAATVRAARPNNPPNAKAVVQRMIGFEYEVGAINTQKNTSWIKRFPGSWVPHQKGEVIMSRNGYDITADSNAGGGTNIEFITRPIDETVPGNILRLRQMARAILADVAAIYNGSVTSRDPNNWVGADEIPRLNGWWWHRFQNRARNWNAISGQLQMTGGVRLSKLAKVLSGTALGQEPQGLHGAAEIKRRHLTKFYQFNPVAVAKQPIFRRALAEVNHRFAQRRGWTDLRARRTLASVIALMAQVPIEKRGGFPNDNSALLLAKTDYSKILHMLVSAVGRTIPEVPFRDCLIDTINAFVPGGEAVNADSNVFPAYYSVNGTTFGGLTFRTWVEWVLPERDLVADPDVEFLEGFDLMTSKHFPGNAQQRKEMRAFGTFGSKIDPGRKVIMEFRNFTSTIPEELEDAMAGIAEYLRTDVNT